MRRCDECGTPARSLVAVAGTLNMCEDCVDGAFDAGEDINWDEIYEHEEETA